MKTNINSTSAWNHVNWKDIHKSVFILQRKIFHFSKLNDIEKVQPEKGRFFKFRGS